MSEVETTSTDAKMVGDGMVNLVLNVAAMEAQS